MKVYYFTGTGNSYYVAKKINSEISDEKLLRITSDMPNMDSSKNDNICIVSPMYYGGIPKIVEKFLRNLNSENVILVLTRNFSPAWVDEQIESLLNSQVTGLYYIDMPGNYLFEYNPPIKKKAKIKIEKADVKINEIISDINSKSLKIKRYNYFIKLFFKLFYKYYLKKVLPATDEKFEVSNDCNGCQLCKRVCPLNNIKMNNNKPVWMGMCQECTACIHICPKEAIQHGMKTRNRNRYINPNIKKEELFIR